MHQFTLAKHTLAARSFQISTQVPLCVLYVLLWTLRRHPSMAPWLGRVSSPREQAATFLSDDSSDQWLVQLDDRLLRGSQAACRRSRLRNVVVDQRGAVEHKHTYVHVLTLWAMATFPTLSPRLSALFVLRRKVCEAWEWRYYSYESTFNHYYVDGYNFLCCACILISRPLLCCCQDL